MAFAGSGAEALSRFGVFGPDIVVLDMQLPDTDGIDVLRQLRTNQPELPAIITTAYSSMAFELNELAERIDAAA
jgi:CheY-like chemotaxis protein